MLSADENETFAFAITADDRVIGSIGVFRQGNIHRLTAEIRIVNSGVLKMDRCCYSFVIIIDSGSGNIDVWRENESFSLKSKMCY